MLGSATDNLYQRCRRVLQGMRRHGHERLSAKQKAGMDSVSILKEETCYKLGEIQTYLTDFRDIILSIEHDNAASAAFLKQPAKGRCTEMRGRSNPPAWRLGGESDMRALCSRTRSLSFAPNMLIVCRVPFFPQPNPTHATPRTIAAIAPMAVVAAVAAVAVAALLLPPARVRSTRTRPRRSWTTVTATRPAPTDRLHEEGPSLLSLFPLSLAHCSSHLSRSSRLSLFS